MVGTPWLPQPDRNLGELAMNLVRIALAQCRQTANLDIDEATQAMFRFDTDACARVLFADTVQPHEYAAGSTRCA